MRIYFRNVTRLHKTSLKPQFGLLEYDALFERETHHLYNDTKIIILSQSKLNLQKLLLAGVELMCDKMLQSKIFRFITCMKYF